MGVGKPLILVGIPAYNEQRHIAEVIYGCKKYADEILVFDDGSKDLTVGMAESLGAQVVSRKHMGYGETIRGIFIEAAKRSPDILITIDGDGQHNPEDIPRFIKAIEGGADIATGIRRSFPRLRGVGNKVIDAVSVSGVSDSECGFRAYRFSKVGFVIPSEMGMGVNQDIWNKARDAKLTIAEIPIEVIYDESSHGQNPFQHGADILFANFKLSAIRHPLMLFGIPGFLTFLASIVLWAWALTVFESSGQIPFGPALAALETTIIGLGLSGLGILIWVMVSVVRMK